MIIKITLSVVQISKLEVKVSTLETQAAAAVTAGVAVVSLLLYQGTIILVCIINMLCVIDPAK